MDVSGFLAEDAPDPRVARLAMIEGLGIPVAGLVPQWHLQELGEGGYSTSRRSRDDGPQVLEAVEISRTYLLWRNPDDHDDPVNLADLEEATRAAVETSLDRPIPEWLNEARRMLRYPRLWDAVRTHWTGPAGRPRALSERLIAHAGYVLTNAFHEQLGIGDDLSAWEPSIPPAALQQHTVVVDGVARPGLLLDTDPFVVGLGCELDDGRAVTVVVDRDAVPLLVLDLVSAAPLRP